MIATKQTIVKGAFICCILALLGGLALMNPSCIQRAKHNQNNQQPPIDQQNNNPSSPVASGDACRKPGGGTCDGNEDCEEWCDDLFRGGSDARKCLKLTVDEVEGMYVAFNDGRRGDEGLLEDPEIDDDDDEDIKSICPLDVKNLLETDNGHWDGLIKDYSQSQAEDVLVWLADDNQVFEDGIEKALNDEDTEDLIKSILNRFSTDITQALTTEIGEDADYDETFISISNSNSLREIANDLLLDDCISDASEGDAKYTAGDGDINKALKGLTLEQRSAACALGEVYCVHEDGRYIFEDSFRDILKAVDDSIEDFIEDSYGLDFRARTNSNKDEDNLEDVCPDLCGKWKDKENSAKKPSVCTANIPTS